MKAPVLFITLVPPLAAACFIWRSWNSFPWDTLRVCGLLLIITGLALVTKARFDLGNSFSVTPQAKALVTTGIYSKIQHPVYVFANVALAGLALFIHQPWLLLILIPLTTVQVLRARREEKVLEHSFGVDYLRYRERTWF